MTFHPKSEFLQVIQARGFVDSCTDLAGLDAAAEQGGLAAYIGFDATAASLHVGSLMQIMMLRWLQRTGNKPIVLMGGGTTRIGDPSFRDEARPLLSPRQIAANTAGIRKVFARFVRFSDTPDGALMVNNAEWLDKLNYIEFLRDTGRHFSVNRMLSFDSVRSRLERQQTLSFLEFNYMLLQSYDFLELCRRYGCRLQIGGSDQWGNIVSGVDLVRRVLGSSCYGLTSPLLTTADGRKMGKTAQGAVWLDPGLLAPYDFWQFWRNTADADVGRFLKLFTEIGIDECTRLAALGGNEINIAKEMLADAVTSLLHGEDAAQAARQTAQAVFEHGATGDALPTVKLSPEQVKQGLTAAQALVQSGLAPSGKVARRMIADGAVRIGEREIVNPGENVIAGGLTHPLRLSAGKKRHAVIRLARED